MLQLAKTLYNRDIISLRNSQVVGTATQPIINPNNLKIEGWYAVDRYSGEDLILPVIEVRELNRYGIAVNDHTAMTPESDLVRLQKILLIRFQLLKKKVVTESKQVVGTISDYSYDDSGMTVQKLYVTPRGLKSLASSDKVIGRSQIVNITDKQITVRDTTSKLPFGAKLPLEA
ncbi:MAG: hypothetical protein M3Q79_02270 [bacterium]|nr:hypothetical protein [bacterium]